MFWYVRPQYQACKQKGNSHMFLFCKPMFSFCGNCRICRDLTFGSVKTRFKAILKKLDLSAQFDFLQLFGEICRQKGYM